MTKISCDNIPLNALELNECLVDQGGPSNLNFSVICSYEGSLSGRTLQLGLKELAKAHPLLRASVQKISNVPHFIETNFKVPFWEYQLTGESQWKEVAEIDLRRFNIEKEPLWRVSLLKGDGRGQIIITFHHAIADGPCAMKAVDQLFQILEDLSQGKTASSVEFNTPFPSLESLYPLSIKEPIVNKPSNHRIEQNLHMCFEKKLLNTDTTNRVLAWAKEQGIKANGVYFAALLLAMKRTGKFNRNEYRAMTVVNLRPYFNPPVGKDIMKLLRVSISSTCNLADDMDIETLSRHIHEDTHAKLREGDHVLALKALSKGLEQNPTPKQSWQNSLQSSDTVTITNIGALDFSGEYGKSFFIKELSFVANTQPFFEDKNNLVLAVLTFRGQTHLDLWGIKEHIDDQTLQAVLTEMEDILSSLPIPATIS